MQSAREPWLHWPTAGARRIALGLLMAAALLAGCRGELPTAAPTATSIPTPASTPTPVGAPILVATPTPVVLGDYTLLTPEQMRADLDELFHRLETTHPDPYARRPKAEVDSERERIARNLAQPLTVVEYYKLLAPLVNSLGDQHTWVSLPGETVAANIQVERFFPFDVQLEGERGFIVFDYSTQNAIPLGAEVLAINDTPLVELARQSLSYFPQSRMLLPNGLWLIFGSLEEFRVQFIPPQADAPQTLSVYSLGLNEMALPPQISQSWTPLDYRTLPGEAIGLLTLNTFSGIGPLLKPAFAQIQADGVEHLIVDVRANGGGPYAELEGMMDYLTGEPFRRCSVSYRPPFGGYGSGPVRESACEWIEPFAVKERFTGKLYLLIGPDTFSAAISFATILQDFGLATLIGEETGDSASYCADVTSELLPLPETGLLYQCSRSCTVRPNGVRDARGVIPDRVVATSVAQQLAGEDPVLDAALALIRSGDAP